MSNNISFVFFKTVLPYFIYCGIKLSLFCHVVSVYVGQYFILHLQKFSTCKFYINTCCDSIKLGLDLLTDHRVQ